MDGRNTSIVEIAKRTAAQIQRDDVSGLAAEMSYRFFLALFPFFIFLAALGSFAAANLPVPDPTQYIVGLLGQSLPPEAANLIGSQLEQVIQNRSPSLLSLVILGAIWAATGGTNATIKALNRAYGVPETRPIWKKYPLAIGLTLLGSITIVTAFIIFFVGQLFAAQIADALGLRGIYDSLIGLVDWAVVILLLLSTVAFLYWAAPNIDLKLKWMTPGALLFTVGWLATTYLFAYYVSHFGSYTATYGALGAVIVTLLWFYVTSLILLVGAELNDVVDEMVDPEQVRKQRYEREKQANMKQGSLVGSS